MHRELNPTLEEVLFEFNGCIKFAKLSLNQVYHQLSLDQQSRDITAFVFQKGISRYTHLIFGMSAAAKHHIEQALARLKGGKDISDDTIMGGKYENECKIEQTYNHFWV